MLYEVTVEFKKDFLEISGSTIRIGIKSKPVKGQANLEIIKKLSNHFGLPTTNIQIRAGKRSSHKIVDILQ